MTIEEGSVETASPPFREPRTQNEAWARDNAAAFGLAFGEACPNVWAPLADWAPMIRAAAIDEARKLVKQISTETRQWVFCLGLTAAIGAVLLVFVGISQETPTRAALLAVWIAWTALWLITYLVARARNRRVKQIQEERFQWLVEVVGIAAQMQILTMRSKASQYAPSADSTFTPVAPPPAPAAFGASDAGALDLVAGWMQYLGETGAQPLDALTVGSLHYLAAVYNTPAALLASQLHTLVGRTAADGRKPLAFTAVECADEAIGYANAVSLPVFEYDAIRGTLAARTRAAAMLLKTGL